MWSDPIDNALAILQTLLDQPSPPTADQIERAKCLAQHAREVRAKEVDLDRLVTPQDRWG